MPPGGHFVYRFVADTPGTFIYHSHDQEAMLNSGLYGAIIVEPSPIAPSIDIDQLAVARLVPLAYASWGRDGRNASANPTSTAAIIEQERTNVKGTNRPPSPAEQHGTHRPFVSARHLSPLARSRGEVELRGHIPICPIS